MTSDVRPSDRHEPVRDDEIAIAQMLREHGPREGAALTEYKRLIEQCDDPGVRYLAETILADEERHHRQITEMLHQIESFLWEVDVEPSTPYLREHRDPELREATERLLQLEREDAAELRQLRKRVKNQDRSSMLPLLVELMIHDTSKHIEILKLIRAHVKKR